MRQKTIEELESTAIKFWPQDLYNRVVEANPMVLLIETQEKFLSILKCADGHPEAWCEILKQSSLYPNVFLKHLCVLTDIGGERLQRVSKSLINLFPKGEFSYEWRGKRYTYTFSSSKSVSWKNEAIGVGKYQLNECFPVEGLVKDVAMLLMWGAAIVDNDEIPPEFRDKCVIGSMLGKPDELEVYVRQRYIYVSRITGGSSANDSGYVCEEYCSKRLRKLLPAHYTIGGHKVKGVSQNDKTLVSFDNVITNNLTGKSCAIEISFQVTTNSVIERKGLLAQQRMELVHEQGHFIAYIIDGAGNFERRSAVSSILQYSDCSVNYSDSGMEELANFIKANC